MIELTNVNIGNGEEEGKLALREGSIFSVKQCSSGDNSYTEVSVSDGNMWQSYCVSESYDRVLRLSRFE
jgi:hypothetical protein